MLNIFQKFSIFLRVKSKVFKKLTRLHDLGSLLLHWPHRLPLFFSLMWLQPQWPPCSFSDLRVMHPSQDLCTALLSIWNTPPQTFFSTLLYLTFGSMVKIASGLCIASLLPFLVWVHGCTAIRPLSLTFLVAVSPCG